MNKIGLVRLLLCVGFFIFFVACEKPNTKKPPKVVKGVLDLTAWNFEKDGTINLDGEWEFYWKEFIPPEKDSGLAKAQSTGQLVGDPLPRIPHYITVPSAWNKFEVDGKPVGGQGYATYRLRIFLPPVLDRSLQSSDVPFGLKLRTTRSAYKLFVNGKIITQVGQVGKSEKETIPSYSRRIVSIPGNAESLELLIQVANFEHKDGGIADPIQIGILEKLQSLREKNIYLDIFLCGSLLLMGVYHFGLFALRRNDKSTLYFGLFCVLFAIRPLLTGEKSWFSLFPDFSWSLASRIEYLAIYFGSPIFLLFLDSIFPNIMPKLVRNGILVISGLLSLTVILLPVIIFTQTLLSMQIVILLGIALIFYVMLVALYRKSLGAKSFFAGFIVFSTIVINDILHEMGFISTGYYAPFGFFIFIFSQAFFLSMRFSNAFLQVETLSHSMEGQNKQLEMQNKKLENLSKVKDEFLSNLSHELRTPLTVVYTYSEMMSRGGVKPEKVQKYSGMIFENADKLNNYVNDLMLVTNLESNIELRKSKVDLQTLLSKTIEKLKPLALEKEILIEFKPAEKMELDCDHVLLETALFAILKNAIVYNKQNGKIIIDVGTSVRTGLRPVPTSTIQITDTGIGIAKEFHEKIFEKFFRVDSSLTYEVSGVGLGLFIAKRIVEMHGGSIAVKSELGSGCEVSLNLHFRRGEIL